MGPKELKELGDLTDNLPEVLATIATPTFDYLNQGTRTFRESIAELRSKANELVGIFPREAFPLASRAVKRFANKVDAIVYSFPGNVAEQRRYCEELRNIWHLEVRPAIYSLELALAVAGGLYLPEDPTLFRGHNRILRDISLEVNVCYRNGAFNACSVLLRRLIEALIIHGHERRGTTHLATNTNTNRFYKLDKLIDDLVANNLFGLTRNSLEALPRLKRLGDWGAHNRNISVRRADLDGIKDDARLCFEELLTLA